MHVHIRLVHTRKIFRVGIPAAESWCACPFFCRQKFADPTRYVFDLTHHVDGVNGLVWSQDQLWERTDCDEDEDVEGDKGLLPTF